MRHAISRTSRSRAMSWPVSPKARSCAVSAVMTWPMLGKCCRSAGVEAERGDAASKPASRSCSVVSSVVRTTRLSLRLRAGDADARAEDDADMDRFRRAGRDEPGRSLRPFGSPAFSHPLALDGPASLVGPERRAMDAQGPGAPFARPGNLLRKGSGAHAPPEPKRQIGMPSLRALSARFSWMPEPGNTMTPIGNISRIWSLRLKGAAFA